MSDHSYFRCWLHLVWATKDRRPILDAQARPLLHQHLMANSRDKGIYLKIAYVNADHVHALIDLPQQLSIETVAKLLKGESSHWLNQERLTPGAFHWQRGYGAFSICQSKLEKACRYIAGQAEHHRQKTFKEEFRAFLEHHQMVWHEEEE